MSKEIKSNIQVRSDTATNWGNSNRVLLSGEFGYDITNKRVKMGDGTTPWNSLTWLADNASMATALNGKVDNSQVLTDVPVNAKFTDTITTINDETGDIKIVIGGRNYLRKDKWEGYVPYNTNPVVSGPRNNIITFQKNNSSGFTAISQLPFPYNANGTIIYTASGIAKINNTPVTNLTWGTDKKLSTYQGETIKFDLDDSTGRFVITQKWITNSPYILHGDIFPATLGATVTIEDFKFEKGTMDTDWTPAPEDFTNLIITSAVAGTSTSTETKTTTPITLKNALGDTVATVSIEAYNGVTVSSSMTTVIIGDVNRPWVSDGNGGYYIEVPSSVHGRGYTKNMIINSVLTSNGIDRRVELDYEIDANYKVTLRSVQDFLGKVHFTS